MVPCIVTKLIRSNKMQQHADIYLLQNHCTCFGCPSHPSSGVHKTVTSVSGTGHSIWLTTILQHGQIRTAHVGGGLLVGSYDLYQRLQLQFYVLLMMGAMDTRNMWSDFAVNKYLHTVASCWILLTACYSFIYSWWWVQWTPETCTMILQ
jgi:hypothetical protein